MTIEICLQRLTVLRGEALRLFPEDLQPSIDRRPEDAHHGDVATPDLPR